MATQEKTLTTSFQLLGQGPLLITLEKGHLAELHIASSAPTPPVPVHRLIRGKDREWLNYTGLENVYAKKTDPSGDRMVIVSYTGT